MRRLLAAGALLLWLAACASQKPRSGPSAPSSTPRSGTTSGDSRSETSRPQAERYRDEINRYRHRIGIALPITVNGLVWKAFATYEAFYERQNGRWNRNRLAAGVTLPLQKHVSFQPAYIWENNRVRGLNDISYLQFGLIVSKK